MLRSRAGFGRARGLSCSGERAGVAPCVPIHVVFQVKHFQETGTGDFVPVHEPSAFWVDEVVDAALHARGKDRRTPQAMTAQAVCEAVLDPGPENRIVVGVATFAPAAILVLDAFEPRAALSSQVDSC